MNGLRRRGLDVGLSLFAAAARCILRIDPLVQDLPLGPVQVAFDFDGVPVVVAYDALGVDELQVVLVRHPVGIHVVARMIFTRVARVARIGGVSALMGTADAAAAATAPGVDVHRKHGKLPRVTLVVLRVLQVAFDVLLVLMPGTFRVTVVVFLALVVVVLVLVVVVVVVLLRYVMVGRLYERRLNVSDELGHLKKKLRRRAESQGVTA